MYGINSHKKTQMLEEHDKKKIHGEKSEAKGHGNSASIEEAWVIRSLTEVW